MALAAVAGVITTERLVVGGGFMVHMRGAVCRALGRNQRLRRCAGLHKHLASHSQCKQQHQQ